jgi:hypothetical protein
VNKLTWNSLELGYLKENFSSNKDKSIAAFLNKSSNAIRIKASRLKLSKESTTYRNSLVLTLDEEQVILGGLMGDLYCTITHTSKNARLEGGHSKKQLGYLNHKISLLQRLKWSVRNNKDGNYLYESKSFPCLNKYYSLFYSNNKKIVNNTILNKIEKLGLLIWYMDDGTYHKRDGRSYLFTNCFTYDEQLVMQKYFEDKWGIYPKIYISNGKNEYINKVWYYLSFPVSETIKLHDLFRSFEVPECMKYKLYYYFESHLPRSIPGVSEAHNLRGVEIKSE